MLEKTFADYLKEVSRVTEVFMKEERIAKMKFKTMETVNKDQSLYVTYFVNNIVTKKVSYYSEIKSLSTDTFYKMDLERIQSLQEQL